MSKEEQRLQEEFAEFKKLTANPAANETIHPAASVLLLRENAIDGGELELLLVKRSQNVRFMPGAWVFPGGKLDASDGEPSTEAFQRCGARETHEECAVMIDEPHAMVWFSHWITPQGLPHRFDTRFFLAPAPPACQPVADGHEVDDICWLTPSAAVECNASDEMTIFFPTLKQLERLTGITTITAAFEVANAAPIEPITPKAILVDGRPRIVLPGDPGYDD
ncbi:MAG: NUDIX hydrolase [Thermoleophilaceae bacterium]|nr:NUDIX hydrolase [Thermoleophilaceae bacterium]